VDPALLLVISACVANVFLGLFVFLRNTHARMNKAFFATVVAICVWAMSNYFTDNAQALNVNIFFNKLAYLSAFLASVSAAIFTHYFGSVRQKYSKYLIILGSLFVASVSALSVTSYVAGSVIKTDSGVLQFKGGSLIIGYMIGLLIMLGLIIQNMYLLMKKGAPIEKNQARVLMIGMTLSVLTGMATNLVVPTLTNNFEFTKYGPPLLSLTLVITFTYAIVTKRLFDIRFVVARSVAYVSLLGILAVLYAFGVFTLGGFFFKENNAVGAQQLYDLSISVILALTFRPLKHFFEKITDDFFYRDHYEPQALLTDLGNVMSREIELVHLSDKVINIMLTQMRLTKALIVVIDQNEIFYIANKESINYRSISLNELKAIGDNILVKDALQPGQKVPEIFSKFGLSVSVGLRSTDDLVGFLLLGEKLSGEIFNDNDIKTMKILSQELAIAIHNARSYTQIQDFNKNLQRRVDEATAQLRAANLDLKKMDGVKNEFLSMATHQLNTPLSVVDGYLSMINDSTNNNLSDQQHEFIEKATHRVRLMKRLVADFLNVSRLETGRFTIDAAPIDFNKLVTEEVNELGPSAKEKAVLLQYIAPEHKVPVVEYDEEKTRQAVMNLIDNAIYYTPKGVVKVFLENDDKDIIFRVVDNGIGVPDAQKSKLFQKFSRADNAKKERPSGSGVGLYLVKRVVEEQGGNIIFESQEGKGSTFGFRLPIKTNVTEQAEEVLPSEDPTPESEEIKALREHTPSKPTQANKEVVKSYYKIIG
jgi:signal transduction histidine kinase